MAHPAKPLDAIRALARLLLTVLALLAAPLAAATPHHLAMRLVAESDRPAAGGSVALALDTAPDPGWHGYWQNPGDAGFPAKLAWTLPPGVSVSPPRYPLPEPLLVAGLMNYVYAHPYAPLVTLTLPSGIAPGTPLPIRLHADYLVCTDSLCVPESADLATTFTVGDGQVTPERRALFDGWRKALPKPLGGVARYQRSGGTIRIAVPYPAAAPLDHAYLFPLASGFVDYAAPQATVRDGDRLVITTKAADGGQGALGGVLRVGPGQGLELRAAPGKVPSPRDHGGWLAQALLAFGGALLGGLVLNVMPCVFPILSLKALSLARANESARAARAEALAYGAGVVLVCVALGGAILLLRAGGAAAGWAFQLQDPRAVLVLLLLVGAIALNLSGLFEVPMPPLIGRTGSAGGAFASGALAAFIATPCTGPFMGAALGAALVLPWPAALAVFAGLGLGLALPFLAIGFVPALRARLPRPGAWMERFRRVMSVPMWLTAIALAWVLGRQAGVNAMALGLVALLVAALALWAAGNRQARGRGFGTVPTLLLLAVAVGGAWGAEQLRAAPGTAAAGTAEPFSEARLAALRAQRRPVFAYFTADWCLTCKVNEQAAIGQAGVQQAFARKHVAVLVGDWTDGNPALGRFIEAHNRAGVPLYLYYAPGAAEPQVLPQILTPAMLEAL